MTTLTMNSFVPEKLINNLEKLTAAQADQIPFGVVKLNDQGSIELYNKYNYDVFAGFNGMSVIGKNYFTEIAPCANNFIFSGRFKRGVTNNELDIEFDYCFTYKLMPTDVRVRLYRDSSTGSNWIFVKKAD